MAKTYKLQEEEKATILCEPAVEYYGAIPYVPKQTTYLSRYEKAKRLATQIHNEERYQELVTQDFYIHKPCPITMVHSQEDILKIIDECENEEEEYISHEEVSKLFAKYENVQSLLG